MTGNSEIYQELQLVMAQDPEVIELGPGAVTRRNSVDMTLFGPILVCPVDYKTPPGWYLFHDLSDKRAELLAPGNSPARLIHSIGEQIPEIV